VKKSTSNIGKRRAAAKAKTVSSGTYQRRREEIAAAAARVFNQKGFRGTTISAVADELNIDRASIYYYISSKEELFDEVIREASEENVAKAQRIQATDAPAGEKLRNLVRGLMGSYAATYPLLYIYIREDLKHVSDKRSAWAMQMKKINRQYDDAVTSIIEEGYRDGSFRDIGPARLVAYGIIGMLNWTNRWFNPETSKASTEEIADMFAELVTGGLENGSLSLPKPARANGKKRTATPSRGRKTTV
jgi:AcrR family transcriptional regulator